MKILGVIPARYQSSRLPGKPLINIFGMPMIKRVYEQCKKNTSLTHIIVATDDDRIFNFCNENSIKVLMTSNKHQSGTDRCAETLELLKKDFDYVINIQGDEPFINPLQIDELVNTLTQGKFQIATLAHFSNNWNEVSKNSNVKITTSQNGNALYFSRSLIPYSKDQIANHLLHIGIYGFKSETLKEIVKLPQSKLEKAEQLEQLRWLENGYTIRVGLSKFPNYSIDTQKDLENLPSWIAAKGIKIA